MKKILVTLLTTVVLFVGIQNLNIFAQTAGQPCGTEGTCSAGFTCNATLNLCAQSDAADCGQDTKACCITKTPACGAGLSCFGNVCRGQNSGQEGAGDAVAQGNCGVNNISTAIGCIPFGDQNALFGFFLKWGIGIGGGIAFLLIIFAGFQIMTSRGDPNRLKAGQELLTSAIAGLLLLIFSLVILRIIGFDILNLGIFA